MESWSDIVERGGDGHKNFNFKFKASEGSLYNLYITVKDIRGVKGITSSTFDLNRSVDIDIDIADTIDRNSPKSLKIKAVDYSGRDINISGEVIIDKIKPIKLFRDRYWSGVDRKIFDNIEFGKRFVSYLKKEDIERVQRLN